MQSDLPQGSEIRFRDPPFWEAYRYQSMAVAAIILIEAVLISFLLHERKKRNNAELEARSRMVELAHVNRHATAGELSSSIAHELNQPLGAIEDDNSPAVACRFTCASSTILLRASSSALFRFLRSWSKNEIEHGLYEDDGCDGHALIPVSLPKWRISKPDFTPLRQIGLM